MFNYKAFIAMTNRTMYHVIMFASFAVAVYIMPLLEVQAVKYIPQTYLHMPAAYLAAYLIAFYILPEIVSYVYIKSREE